MFLEGPFQISLFCDSVINASQKWPKTGEKNQAMTEGEKKKKKIRKEINYSQHQWKEEVPVHWNFMFFMLQGLLE